MRRGRGLNWFRWSPPSPNAPRGVLFMHERISPGGNRRLVVIRYLANASGTRPESFLGYNFDPRVFIPGNLSVPAIAVPRDITPGGLSSDASPLPPLKIFAGQPDANDASRFTIRFLADGAERVVDGELDDQDRITLTLRPLNPAQRARRIVY